MSTTSEPDNPLVRGLPGIWAALADAADAMVVVDTAGRIVFFNRSAARMFGRPTEETLGQSAALLLPPQDDGESLAERAERLQAALRVDGRLHLEAEVLTRDGRRVPVEAGLSVTVFGEDRYYLGCLRDTAGRQATERALSRSQAVLLAMQQSLPLGVFMCNPAGQCTYVNPRCEQILGLRAADCYGDGWAAALHPEDLDPVREAWMGAAERAAPFSSEHRFVHEGGRVVWTSVRAAPVCYGEERLGFVGVIDDVTERRGMRLELCRYTESLENANQLQQEQASALEEQHVKLQFQAEALAEAQRAADDANQAKSAFLANMSHEIRTPMTAILGYADILAETLQSPEQREMALTVRRNASYLLELVNDILDLSKIEAGKLAIEGLPLAPQELVSDVVSLMQVRAQAKGLRLSTVALTPLPRSMRGDPLRLRQCLVNLVGNALKFTEVGEVCVALALEQADGPGPMLRIDVRDSGIGMSAEQLGRLFQPFAQADATTSRRFGGTGLGLTICRRLSELMGGALSVQSELGKGSVFSLRVPTGPLEEAPTVSAPVKPEPTTTNTAAAKLCARILLAEDGADNQRLIAHVLRKAGATVEIVADGAQAVQRALSALHEPSAGPPFDLVLMDMQMPVLDGYEATRHLRIAGYPGPIVALTAHAMSDDRAKCLAAGCDDFASKPLRREELFATLHRCLDAARTHETARLAEP